jgi:hypothetical protein
MMSFGADPHDDVDLHHRQPVHHHLTLASSVDYDEILTAGHVETFWFLTSSVFHH